MVFIITDILDGIKFVINFFLDKAPKPLLLLFFLLLLLLFGSVISMTMHLSGIHCKTDKKVVKVPLIDVATNVQILFNVMKTRITGQTESIKTVHPYQSYLREGDCAFILKNVGGDYQYCDIINESGCSFYYITPECFNCTSVDTGWIRNEDAWYGWNYLGDLCYGDAYRSAEEWSFLKTHFDCESLCSIPEHYKFNSQTGYYECIDLDYCGDNATIQPDYLIDNILNDAGYENLYQDSRSDEKSYERLITITCDDNLNPDLTFFGIPLFDYRIWLLIYVLAVMFWFFHVIRN